MPPRKTKSTKAATSTRNFVREKALYGLAPWSCKHFHTHSEIEAYLMAAGDWQTVAEVRQSANLSAEEMANYIANVVNDHDKLMNILDDMITALETCLDSKGLDWSAENEVDIVLRRARLMRKPISSTSGNA